MDKFAVASRDRESLPGGTLFGPLIVDTPGSKWCLFELRVSGDGPFFMPQLIVGSEKAEEQNVAISLIPTSKNNAGSRTFAAPISSERLNRRLYVIPSLKSCSINNADMRVTALSKAQVAVNFLKGSLRSPKLVMKSVFKDNQGFQFASRNGRPSVSIVISSLVELATRGFPNPDQLYFGPDPRYCQWTNARFETLIPRRMLPESRELFHLQVAVIRSQSQSDDDLCLTVNSLIAAGIPQDSILTIDDGRREPQELSTTTSFEEFLEQLITLKERYILCLRAGDTVSRDLLDVLRTSSPSADPKCVYLDHDHLTTDGALHDFEFKPDCSPNSLIFRNYPSRAALVKASLATRLLHSTPALEATGVLGLLYACEMEASRNGNAGILHIAVPAIHLRRETDEEIKTRSDQEQAARYLFLGKYAPRLRVNSSPLAGSSWQSNPEPDKTVSIVIPTRNRADLLKEAIESITALTAYPHYEIVVIDNQSDDPQTVTFLRELSDRGGVAVKDFDEPFNFARMHNAVIPELLSDYILMLNNDTQVVNALWLSKMIDLFELPNIGIVGNKLLYPDHTIQHVGATGGLKGPMSHHLVGQRDELTHPILSFPRDVLAVTGACLLIPRILYLECGGMDEKLAVSYNDMDLCLSVRVNTGKAVLVSSHGGVIHKESKSRGQKFNSEQQALLNREAEYFDAKWRSHIRPDPFYNPNLSLDRDFEPW